MRAMNRELAPHNHTTGCLALALHCVPTVGQFHVGIDSRHCFRQRIERVQCIRQNGVGLIPALTRITTIKKEIFLPTVTVYINKSKDFIL